MDPENAHCSMGFRVFVLEALWVIALLVPQ